VEDPNANSRDREDLHIGENAETAADNAEGANYERSTDGLGKTVTAISFLSLFFVTVSVCLQVLQVKTT